MFAGSRENDGATVWVDGQGFKAIFDLAMKQCKDDKNLYKCLYHYLHPHLAAQRIQFLWSIQLDMEDKRFGCVDRKALEMRGTPGSSLGTGGMCVVAIRLLHGCRMVKVLVATC